MCGAGVEKVPGAYGADSPATQDPSYDCKPPGMAGRIPPGFCRMEKPRLPQSSAREFRSEYSPAAARACARPRSDRFRRGAGITRARKHPELLSLRCSAAPPGVTIPSEELGTASPSPAIAFDRTAGGSRRASGCVSREQPQPRHRPPAWCSLPSLGIVAPSGDAPREGRK